MITKEKLLERKSNLQRQIAIFEGAVLAIEELLEELAAEEAKVDGAEKSA